MKFLIFSFDGFRGNVLTRLLAARSMDFLFIIEERNSPIIIAEIPWTGTPINLVLCVNHRWRVWISRWNNPSTDGWRFNNWRTAVLQTWELRKRDHKLTSTEFRGGHTWFSTFIAIVEPGGHFCERKFDCLAQSLPLALTFASSRRLDFNNTTLQLLIHRAAFGFI